MAHLSNFIIRSTLDNFDRNEALPVFTSNLPLVIDRLLRGEIPNVPMETFAKFYNRYKHRLSERDKTKLYAASFRSFVIDDFGDRIFEPNLSWMTLRQIMKGLSIWREIMNGLMGDYPLLETEQMIDLEEVVSTEQIRRDILAKRILI
jgi:hypothetical protein